MGCVASNLPQVSTAPELVAIHPVLERLKEGAPRSVVVLAGAGISTNAGVPDFRTPGTGLYDNLQKFNLPYPKAIFDLDFFRCDPEPFSILAKELWPSNFHPTMTHIFVLLLDQKNMLLRHYTQNVDGLDRAAGISEDRIVEAHGSFGAGHCIDCQAVYSADFIRDILFQDQVVFCTECKGLVKPDIVFFGESLPKRFHSSWPSDLEAASVVICMGTSLQVMPFASLVKKSNCKSAQRILINREVPRAFGRTDQDLVLLGECDKRVLELAEYLGWKDELLKRYAGSRPPDDFDDSPLCKLTAESI